MNRRVTHIHVESVCIRASDVWKISNVYFDNGFTFFFIVLALLYILSNVCLWTYNVH